MVARIGDTQALVTANAASSVREGTDFFPLTVDVEEKSYAAGKIPGSFFRREGRPSDQAVLVCRLIDRPLRPSFPKGFRNETQVVVTVLGADLENPHDVVSINGASAALILSGLPFDGPIGAVRLAYSQEGTWVPHPTYQETEESTFQIVVAGRLSGEGDDVAIMMVEAGGTEKAWSYYEAGAPKVTEAVIAEGLEACKTWIRESIELQKELVGQGRQPRAARVGLPARLRRRDRRVGPRIAEAKLVAANQIADKTERNVANDEIKAEVIGQLTLEGAKHAGLGRGHDGVVGFVANQMDVLDDMWLRVDDHIHDTDDCVVVAITFGGRARHSGLEVTLHPVHVFRLRDGKPVHWGIFQEREQALEAVGLRE